MADNRLDGGAEAIRAEQQRQAEFYERMTKEQEARQKCRRTCSLWTSGMAASGPRGLDHPHLGPVHPDRFFAVSVYWKVVPGPRFMAVGTPSGRVACQNNGHSLRL